MAILVLGANGFIGRHVAEALEAAGFAVVRGTRAEYDFTRHGEAALWLPRIAGCEAVVNAVGLFRESAGRSFEAIHARAPMALFEACAAARVPVVQVSALGAAPDAPTPFLRSKALADAHLLALPVPSLVVQPSLVFGADGESARMFTALASLPVIPVPGQGMQPVQPVHVGDLATAIAKAVRAHHFPRTRIAAVGPEPLNLREYLGRLRAGLGLRPAPFLGLPPRLVAGASRLGIGSGDADALRMLEAGSAADSTAFTQLLGHAPRDARNFIAPHEAADARTAAGVTVFAPVLRFALALMWLWAAVVSAGLFPVGESLAMLARVGLTGTVAQVALYGACALDLALGVATLVVHRRRLWTLQALLVLGYTAIITVFLPQQWLHPFGPVVKNVPILAAILLMRALERR